MTEKLLSTKDAAIFLGVHPNTIRNMIKDGRLSSIKTRGKTGDYRFRITDLETYLENSGNPSMTISDPESYLSPLEQKIQDQDELQFIISCGNPYHIFGSYLETLDAATYSQALRGKSVIWVQETMRQIRLHFGSSSLVEVSRIETLLSHIKIGISGMRRKDGKIVITSFLIYSYGEDTYILDGTLQQFHPQLKRGIVVLDYQVSTGYYWSIDQLSEVAFQAAVNDRNSAYFRNYLEKLVMK